MWNRKIKLLLVYVKQKDDTFISVCETERWHFYFLPLLPFNHTAFVFSATIHAVRNIWKYLNENFNISEQICNTCCAYQNFFSWAAIENLILSASY